MSKQPKPGIVFPVEVESVHDGDTVQIRRIGSDLIIPLRLLDCWAPEVSIRGNARAFDDAKQSRIIEAGLAARDALRGLAMDPNASCVVEIPFATIRDRNLMDLFTFGRLLAFLWVNDENASRYLVDRGLATATKEELIEKGLA